MNDKLFTDIELLYREDKRYYDLAITQRGDLKADNSWDTGLNLALLTDGRADKSEVTRPENQRGTIVDLFTPKRNGSKLWLLEQARNDAGAVNRAIDYCKNALKFFTEENYAKTILVDGRRTSKGIILTIDVYGKDGEIDKYRYDAWNNSLYRQ
jgi:phage gp46-like protein